MELNHDHQHLDGASSAAVTKFPVDPAKRKQRRPNKSMAAVTRSVAEESREATSGLSTSWLVSSKRSRTLHRSGKRAPAMTTSISDSKDVIIEILIRLPVPSIVKCMCVCKQWRDLIKSDVFVKTHLSYSLNCSPPTFLLGHRARKSAREVFNLCRDGDRSCLSQMIPSPFEQNLDIIGSVHGLICLRLSHSFFSFNTIFKIFIWNPLIKRYLKIPPEPHTKSTTDGHSKHAVMGFGFDSVRNDYKFVKVVFAAAPGGIKCLRVGVYSLKESSWRMLDANKARVWAMASRNMSSCFANGSIHWIAIKNGFWSFFSFDINDECFNRNELPRDLIIGRLDLLEVHEIKGLLSIFHYKNEGTLAKYSRFKSCDIWVKKEYNVESSWSRSCKVELEDQVLWDILGPRENGDILMVKLVKVKQVETELELVSYDCKTKGIKTYASTFSSNFYGEAYKESLLLLDVGCPYVEPKME